jgi:N6-L-threonylcarbamoyladenine synthase
VLGIESSCDDLAAAVVRDGSHILSSVVHAQDRVHAPYGGVVPELASRDHVRHVQATVERALAFAGVGVADLDAIGVTAGPGLIGSLLVGLCFAKALAYSSGKPLVAVHHIEGHLASATLSTPGLAPPFVGFVVSGGHTALYRVESLAEISLLGQTRDDSAGEAFDKVAKRLGLGYPGGREVNLAAQRGSADAIAFPRPMLGQGLDLSFSGLKTAVALEVARREAAGEGRLLDSDVADVAASFQEAAIDVLVDKARRALAHTGLGRLALVGGLAANTRLRERMAGLAAETGADVRFPPIALCTDNAAMIAAVADRRLVSGKLAGPELQAFSRVAPPFGAPRGAKPSRP